MYSRPLALLTSRFPPVGNLQGGSQVQSGDCFVNNDSQSEELASVIRRPEASGPGSLVPAFCMGASHLVMLRGGVSLGWACPALGTAGVAKLQFWSASWLATSLLVFFL